MTFAEWEASRKGGLPPVAADAQDAEVPSGNAHPTAAGYGNSEVDRLLAEAKGTLSKSDMLSHSIGNGPSAAKAPAPDRSLLSSEPYQASDMDSPLTAAGNELSRTGARAMVGLARSPMDAVKGALGIPAALADSAKTAITNPRGFLSTIPEALKSIVTTPAKAIVDPTTDPTEAASLGGQIAFGEGAPALAKAGIRAVPEAASASMRGLAKAATMTGKGAEALGSSTVAKMASKYGPLEALVRMDPIGLAAAAAPPLLKSGGKMLQRAGQAVSDASPLKGLRSLVDKYLPAAAEEAPSAADVMKGKVSEAKGYEDTGFSHQMAGKLADVPVGEETPYASKQTAKKVTYPADVKVEQADLRSQGFGEPAINKLTKADQKAASGWSRSVLSQRIQQLADKLRAEPVGYGVDDISGSRTLSRGAQYKNVKNAKATGSRSPVIDGLRAIVNSMDDAANFGRSAGGGRR